MQRRAAPTTPPQQTDKALWHLYCVLWSVRKSIEDPDKCPKESGRKKKQNK